MASTDSQRYDKIRKKITLVMILIISVSLLVNTANASFAPSAGWLRTEGSLITSVVGNAVGLYGVNNYVRLQNNQLKFQTVKANGFDTIRLAFWKYDIEHPSYDDPSVDKSGLAAIDKAVDWSTSLGLKIILDQHNWGPYGGQQGCWPAPGEFLSNSSLQLEWLNMWEQIVDRYKSNPTVVGIDIMNEPYMMGQASSCPGSAGISGSSPWSVWEGIAKNAVLDLKTHNPNLLFIVEGWTNDHPWSDTAFLQEPNVVYSSHLYYYGAKNWASWGQAYASGDFATGKQLLAKWIDDNYMSYVNQGIPFWIGETGFLTKDPYWQQEMTDELQLFDQRNISYSAYTAASSPWNDIFDLFNQSSSNYALTTVGQLYSSHVSGLQQFTTTSSTVSSTSTSTSNMSTVATTSSATSTIMITSSSTDSTSANTNVTTTSSFPPVATSNTTQVTTGSLSTSATLSQTQSNNTSQLTTSATSSTSLASTTISTPNQTANFSTSTVTASDSSSISSSSVVTASQSVTEASTTTAVTSSETPTVTVTYIPPQATVTVTYNAPQTTNTVTVKEVTTSTITVLTSISSSASSTAFVSSTTSTTSRSTTSSTTSSRSRICIKCERSVYPFPLLDLPPWWLLVFLFLAWSWVDPRPQRYWMLGLTRFRVQLASHQFGRLGRAVGREGL